MLRQQVKELLFRWVYGFKTRSVRPQGTTKGATHKCISIAEAVRMTKSRDKSRGRLRFWVRTETAKKVLEDELVNKGIRDKANVEVKERGERPSTLPPLEMQALIVSD